VWSKDPFASDVRFSIQELFATPRAYYSMIRTFGHSDLNWASKMGLTFQTMFSTTILVKLNSMIHYEPTLPFRPLTSLLSGISSKCEIRNLWKKSTWADLGLRIELCGLIGRVYVFQFTSLYPVSEREKGSQKKKYGVILSAVERRQENLKDYQDHQVSSKYPFASTKIKCHPKYDCYCSTVPSLQMSRPLAIS